MILLNGSIESVRLTQRVDEKMNTILITKRWKRNWIHIKIEEHIITFNKYLGVVIDRKRSIKQQLQYAYSKAAMASMALARMMSKDVCCS